MFPTPGSEVDPVLDLLGMILVIILYAVAVAISLLPFLAVKAFRKKRRGDAVMMCIIWLVLVAPFVCIAYWNVPGKNVIIARAVSPDGVELCVTHISNYQIVEPYTIGYYIKRPGKRWGWITGSHEDGRWFSGSITFDDEGTFAHIKRDGLLKATFDLRTDTWQSVGVSGCIVGVQGWMPVGWTPETPVDYAKRNRRRPPSNMLAPSKMGGSGDLPSSTSLSSSTP